MAMATHLNGNIFRFLYLLQTPCSCLLVRMIKQSDKITLQPFWFVNVALNIPALKIK